MTVPRFLLMPCVQYGGGDGWNDSNELHHDFNVARARARALFYEDDWLDWVTIVDLLTGEVTWTTSVTRKVEKKLTISERGKVPQ